MRTAEINLWTAYEQGAHIAITTNGTINDRDRAVMGRGCAAEAVQRFKGINKYLALCLHKWGNRTFIFKSQRLITFPVKHHWRETADFKLIETSAIQLMEIINKYDLPVVYLPRPGCGNGHRNWDDIRPIIEPILDNRVVVITFPRS